jgi:hypothetical protein
MFRPGRVALLCALSVLAAATLAPGSAGAQGGAERRSATIALWPSYPTDNLGFAGEDKPYEPQDLFLRALERRPSLSLGLINTIQGEYTQEQTLLDFTQGTRQSSTLYSPRDPEPLRLDVAQRRIPGWDATIRRARTASVTIRPGLLAGTIPGGAAYAGVSGTNTVGAIAAADRAGRVAEVSLGPAATLARRARALSARRRLVVVALPPDPAGMRQLDALIAERSPGEMLMIAQVPPTPPDRAVTRPPPRYFKQTAFALATGAPSAGLTSGTTRHDGLVTGIDVAPTVLDWLGIDAPAQMRGEAIETAGRVSAKRLEELRRRWSDVRGARQSSSFRAVLALAGIVFLLVGALRGVRAAIGPALRIAALGVMWWPTTVLAAAAVEPQARLLEIALISSSAVLLAAITDRLVRWPRGPIVPAAVGIVAYTVDLAAGGDLLTRSALGPSVAFGARFFGVSNELEPLLPILMLTGLAAWMTGREVTRRTTVVYALCGLALVIVVGWGRLGADVGGVITVGVGVAVATLVMLPGGITRRALVVAALVPVAALALLIAIDLLASGGAHLSRNLLRAENARELWELVSRRYELAFKVLRSGRTPAYFLGAALAVWFAIRNRHLIYASLPHRAWSAALLGGLAAGIAGTLTNDSGPILLVNSVLALAGVTAYVLGSTRSAGAANGTGEGEPGERPAPPAADPVLAR